MDCSRTLYITIERHRLLIMVGLISAFAQNDSKIQRGLLLCRLNSIKISYAIVLVLSSVQIPIKKIMSRVIRMRITNILQCNVVGCFIPHT